jgi:hypothetical protein
MVRTWLEALQMLDEVPSIQLTDLEEATTAVARWRPVALLLEQDLFEFDKQEFLELARDVGAELVTVETRTSKEAIARVVLPKLEAALTRWCTRDPALR